MYCFYFRKVTQKWFSFGVKKKKSTNYLFKYIENREGGGVREKDRKEEPTRMMNLIAAHPEVAMTFALLGTRLKSVGTMASAPWSNLFPKTVERCLQRKTKKFFLNIKYSRLYNLKIFLLN